MTTKQQSEGLKQHFNRILNELKNCGKSVMDRYGPSSHHLVTEQLKFIAVCCRCHRIKTSDKLFSLVSAPAPASSKPLLLPEPIELSSIPDVYHKLGF